MASYPLSFVRIWFCWILLVLHQEPLFGLPVKLAVSASAECELKLSSKQHNNNNSQVHSGLPANFHCFVLPSYSVRSQLFLCLSCLDPSIVRTWADLAEDGGVLKYDIFSWEKVICLNLEFVFLQMKSWPPG